MSSPSGSLTTLAAGNGFHYTTANTAITTEKHYGIVVVGDTVLTTWEDADGNDLIARFNISGVTLTSDFPPLIIPGNGSSSNIRASATNGGICLLRG